jgi:hypothetical protein
MSTEINNKISKINKNIQKLKDEKNLTKIISLQKKIKDDIKFTNEYIQKLEKKANIINLDDQEDEQSNTDTISISSEDEEIDIDKYFKIIKEKYSQLQDDTISIEEHIDIKNNIDEKIKNLIKIIKSQKLKIEEIE